MRKTDHKHLSIVERAGLSNLWREGCGQEGRSPSSVFYELQHMLEKLDCVTRFVEKEKVTEVIRKKIWLTLELANEKTERCDAYLEADASHVLFYPNKAEILFKEALWFRFEGILEDEECVIDTAKKIKEIEDELFPNKEDSPPSSPPAEEAPTK